MNSTHSNIVDNKYIASVAFASDCEAHNLITEEVSLFYSINLIEQTLQLFSFTLLT